MGHRVSVWRRDFFLGDAVHLMTSALAADISRLWGDPAMRCTWEVRRQSHIMDNTPYFLSRVEEVSKAEYRPTFADYVRVRDQTSGIVVKHFVAETEMGVYRFDVTDVGGQRSERRKWMNLFDNISVVVYLMALSAYDQCLYEDNTRNCWDETLQLFAQTSHQKVFALTDWVCFLNKNDIFEAKIARVPFSVYRPDFNELYVNDGGKVKEFVRDQFVYLFNEGYQSKGGGRAKRRGNIYFHVTNATQSEEVGAIIERVQVDLIKSQMKKMGYLM